MSAYINPEADEIDFQDLEAAADLFDRLAAQPKPKRGIWRVTQHCPGEAPEPFGTYFAYSAIEAMEIAQTQSTRADCTWTAEQAGKAKP